MPPSDTTPTAAIIGSFRQFYKDILNARQTIIDGRIAVTSPLGAPIIEQGIPFVRFQTDEKDLTDAEIQTLALHRILRADFVYAVTPSGYVGRTTCYEIGRIIQAGKPIYFSEAPADLPLRIKPGHIVTPSQLVDLVERKEIQSPYLSGKSTHDEWEYRLLSGEYLSI
ncbi:hypothetical protein [Amycolatopsis sp. cmx-8-4]|uniref:hypothetical protein n=1 Tax=Amycolatopsis sp. cmx-8-4 TaxID=2790947 RepID=UPI00397BFD05